MEDEGMKHEPVDEASIKALETEAETIIVNHIRAARKSVTRWDRGASRILKNTLKRTEASLLGPANFTTNFPDIEKLREAFQVLGIGIDLKYSLTDPLESILPMIDRMGVHWGDDPQVEFAVAVQAFPYSNALVVLWAFIAALYKNP
jgi:hypothetical protein